MFVGGLFLLCMCVFLFRAPRFVSTTANSSFWLPYFFMFSLFLFYIRHYGNFCDELYGRQIFVLRYANLLLSKFGTA